jgi:hypothetical protein
MLHCHSCAAPCGQKPRCLQLKLRSGEPFDTWPGRRIEPPPSPAFASISCDWPRTSRETYIGPWLPEPLVGEASPPAVANAWRDLCSQCWGDIRRISTQTSFLEN